MALVGAGLRSHCGLSSWSHMASVLGFLPVNSPTTQIKLSGIWLFCWHWDPGKLSCTPTSETQAPPDLQKRISLFFFSFFFTFTSFELRPKAKVINGNSYSGLNITFCAMTKIMCCWTVWHSCPSMWQEANCFWSQIHSRKQESNL